MVLAAEVTTVHNEEDETVDGGGEAKGVIARVSGAEVSPWSAERRLTGARCG